MPPDINRGQRGAFCAVCVESVIDAQTYAMHNALLSYSEGRKMAQHPNKPTAKGGKIIRFDLETEMLTAWEGHTKVYEFQGVPGMSGHETGRGIYKIFRKAREYRSKKYDADMNYAMFFSADGKAIHQYHAGPLGLVRFFRRNFSDWFGSHGCIRLREEDAAKLFDWAPVGTVVHIS